MFAKSLPCIMTWLAINAYRRIARATGAQVVLTLADMDGNETFDASMLGSADEVRACICHSWTSLSNGVDGLLDFECARCLSFEDWRKCE